jgi:predicted nucleic acid-binding Zn ribbon protein
MSKQPKNIGSLLARAIGRPEIIRKGHALGAMQSWEEIVGKVVSGRSSPEKFEAGLLTVKVVGAVWAQELRMKKEIILEKLNEKAGEKVFADIRFVVCARLEE